MRDRLTTLVEFAGLGMITLGAMIVAVPFGLMVGGIAFVLIGVMEGRK